MNVDSLKRALLDEIEQITGSLEESRPDTASALPGWTILDVARHVSVTPAALAGQLNAHLDDRAAVAALPLPPEAGRDDVLTALRDRAASMASATAGLRDEHLDGQIHVPGVGALPVRVALCLALAEIALHRFDVQHALFTGFGATTVLALCEVLPSWLLFSGAGAPRPEQPCTVRFVGRVVDVTFGFDGGSWRLGRSSGTRHAGISGPDEGLLLAMAGRIPVAEVPLDVTGSVGLAHDFKRFLPGP